MSLPMLLLLLVLTVTVVYNTAGGHHIGHSHVPAHTHHHCQCHYCCYCCLLLQLSTMHLKGITLATATFLHTRTINVITIVTVGTGAYYHSCPQCSQRASHCTPKQSCTHAPSLALLLPLLLLLTVTVVHTASEGHHAADRRVFARTLIHAAHRRCEHRLQLAPAATAAWDAQLTHSLPSSRLTVHRVASSRCTVDAQETQLQCQIGCSSLWFVMICHDLT